MSSAPVFASVAHNGLLQLDNAASTNLSAAIITGVAAGTRIKENTECRRAGDHAPARRPCSFDRQSPAFCWITLK